MVKKRRQRTGIRLTAVSGEDLQVSMSKLMAPEQANRDHDVLRAVEAWEDRHRDCVKLGMKEMDE